MILLVGAMIFDHEGYCNALEGHDDDHDHDYHDEGHRDAMVSHLGDDDHDNDNEGHCDAVVSHLGDGDHDNDDEGDRDAVVGHPLVRYPSVPAMAAVHWTARDQNLVSIIIMISKIIIIIKMIIILPILMLRRRCKSLQGSFQTK